MVWGEQRFNVKHFNVMLLLPLLVFLLLLFMLMFMFIFMFMFMILHALYVLTEETGIKVDGPTPGCRRS